MNLHTTASVILALTFSAFCLNAQEFDYPPLQEPDTEPAHWGEHVQRTLSLLAESTPERRQPVRILFYGQSIIGGKWHSLVERDLRERFPHADLTVENRALGGYSTQYLRKTVLNDILITQPDLIVFRVSGHHIEYQEIIHTIRSRSAAEVMILTSHWGRDTLQEDGSLMEDDWNQFFDGLLPLVAEAYQCELVDVRWPWKAYLEEHNLQPGALLTDNIHLNDHGKWLMAQLVSRQLVYRPDRTSSSSMGLATVLEVGKGKDLQWDDGKLTIEFTGSRVDAISAVAGGSAADVTIDGLRPSAHSTTMLHSRATSLIRPLEWPEINRITFDTLPVRQIWTVEVESFDRDSLSIEFSLSGSQTGYDGRGSSLRRFVSNSGQVVIEPEDWCFPRKFNTWEQEDLKPGMKIRWQTVALAGDVYFPQVLLEEDRKLRVSLIDGLPNRDHVLELYSNGTPPPITHLVVYRPLLPEGSFEDLGVGPGDARLDMSRFSAPTPEE